MLHELQEIKKPSPTDTCVGPKHGGWTVGEADLHQDSIATFSGAVRS